MVVTTYGTLAQEFERYNKFRADNRDRTIDLNDRSYAANFPLFHSENAIFHRVIIDEAHCIKNRNTQTAQACRLLRAAYRWCLTGTPMMEFLSSTLLKFLRVKQYRSWEDFHQVRANTWCLAMPSRTDTLVEAFGLLFGERGDPRGVAMNQLRALLKTIMLRRKKNSKLDGKPILQLPQKTEYILKQSYPRGSATFTNSLRKVPSHVQRVPPGWNCRQKLFPHSRATASTSPSMLPPSPQFRCQLCNESRQRRRRRDEGPGHVRCCENQGD